MEYIFCLILWNTAALLVLSAEYILLYSCTVALSLLYCCCQCSTLFERNHRSCTEVIAKSNNLVNITSSDFYQQLGINDISMLSLRSKLFFWSSSKHHYLNSETRYHMPLSTKTTIVVAFLISVVLSVSSAWHQNPKSALRDCIQCLLGSLTFLVIFNFCQESAKAQPSEFKNIVNQAPS